MTFLPNSFPAEAGCQAARIGLCLYFDPRMQ
jgi:hypothetical protein